MKDIKLVCLVWGSKKNGKGPWYKATIISHNSEGKPITGEFFLPEEVGERCVKEGLIENVPIHVDFDFDDFLHPAISNISKVPGATQSVAKAEVKP